MSDFFGDMAGGYDIAAEAMAKEKAQQYQLQAKALAIQGKVAEANAWYQRAQIEMRKIELAQQKYLTERAQQLSASGTLAQLRGPGNAAQFIDFARRAGSFGVNSGALAQLARGVMPEGSFVPGGSGQPTSLQERFGAAPATSGPTGTPSASGQPAPLQEALAANLGAPSEDAIAARDRADRQLASQISSRTNTLARGSLESLSPYERAYLGSYSEAQGYDWDSVTEAYKRAGIQQGKR